MSLLATAEGTSVITEAIFENRLQHVAELQRMGAAIRTQATRPSSKVFPSSAEPR